MRPREPFEQSARQAATLLHTDHRPWPIPRSQWLMAQTWERLLFAHWPVAPERMQDLVPGLQVDTFDGRAWLGVTPFVVTGLRIAGTPPLPVVSSFPEVNVRTYVTVDDRPGIYFFSLDAASDLAVRAARRFYQLPYFGAHMDARREDGWVAYESVREDPRGHAAKLRCRYRARGPVQPASPGSLEYFLAERYCLYTVGRDGSVLRGEIHHPPWPLQEAEATLHENTMPPPGLAFEADEPLIHYAERQDTLIWPLTAAQASEG